MKHALRKPAGIFHAIVSFIVVGQCLVGCATPDDQPGVNRLEKMKGSKQFNQDTKKFQNKNPNFFIGSNFKDTFREMLFGGQIRRPLKPLPGVKPDLVGFSTPGDGVRFIWLGHSTFLLRIDGITILVDPVFGDYVSPVPIYAKRFQPPVIQIADIPDIDMVLVSHDHYDHLEKATIQNLAARGVKFVVPIGVGGRLEGWGVARNKISELDWWEKTSVGNVTIVCAPAQHFSGRKGLDGNKTLWASWAILGSTKRVFYSADGGYADHFKEIGDKLGPFDLTFMEVGQYNQNWINVHMMPDQSVQAHIDVKGNMMVPVHWGAYSVSLHDWFDPPQRATAEAAAKGVNLLTPMMGQLVDTDNPPESKPWWLQAR